MTNKNKTADSSCGMDDRERKLQIRAPLEFQKRLRAAVMFKQREDPTLTLTGCVTELLERWIEKVEKENGGSLPGLPAAGLRKGRRMVL